MSKTNEIKFNENDVDRLVMNIGESDCIELPKDASLETVIDLINDLGISFTDKRNEKWKKYYVKKEFT